jgi:hypothetical protein
VNLLVDRATHLEVNSRKLHGGDLDGNQRQRRGRITAGTIDGGRREEGGLERTQRATRGRGGECLRRDRTEQNRTGQDRTVAVNLRETVRTEIYSRA